LDGGQLNGYSINLPSELLQLLENDPDASEPLEPPQGALQSAKDVIEYCNSNKFPKHVRATGNAVIRSFHHPETSYQSIWSNHDFYKDSGSMASRFLNAECAILDERHVNGARYRINALLFALHYNARVQELGTNAHRQSTVMTDLMAESSKTKRQIEFLLKQGRWNALWVCKFGIGAILALGEFLA
jgi:hypothetical protein